MKQLANLLETLIFNYSTNKKIEIIEKHLHKKASVWDVFTPQLIVGEKELSAFHDRDQMQKDSRGELSIVLEEPMIRSMKDFAVATYCLEFVYQEPNAMRGKVRITDIFIMEEERWKILHHHEGIVPNDK